MFFFSEFVYLIHKNLSSCVNAGSSRGTSGRSVGGGSTSHSSEGGSDWTTHDTGPHREMAVDVPESFVGRTKTPPRYPPPKPTNPPVVSTSVPVNNNSPGLRKKVVTAQAAQVASNGLASSGGGGMSAKPAPPSRDHLRMEEDGRTVVINHAAPPQQVRPTPLLMHSARIGPARPSQSSYWYSTSYRFLPALQNPTRLQAEPEQTAPAKSVGVEVDVLSAEQMERIRKYQVMMEEAFFPFSSTSRVSVRMNLLGSGETLLQDMSVREGCANKTS